MILISPPCFAIELQDSIPSSKQDSLPPTSDQYRFVVTFDSMTFWYEQYKVQKKIEAKMQDIIDGYALETGIRARDRESLHEAFRIDRIGDDYIQTSLNDCLELSKKKDRRLSLWKTSTVVVTVSFATYLIVDKVKK